MKDFSWKDRITYGFIMVLILLLIFSNCRYNKMQEKLYDEVQRGNKAIVDMDRTKKERDGQYAKLVNTFISQSDLLGELKDQNKDLYKQLKKNDEKLLMMNNTIVSLRGQIAEGFGQFNPEDSTVIDLDLKYPNDTDWFVNWKGSVDSKTAYYKGDWKFGKLPLQVILTETDRGIWNSRLIGPDWLLVDSIDVKALKPKETREMRKFGFMLGGGYIKSFNQGINDGVSIGVGTYFKNHSLLLNGTTNSTVGFNYYYRFTSFKKNN
jgi:uncharacterized membrane-anchored protein YhcB (DUF1043 family)